MDPTSIVCTSRDTLKETMPDFDENVLPAWYEAEDTILSTNIVVEPLTTTSNLHPLYVDTVRYEALQDVKDAFNNPNFAQARNATNPYEYIGRSIFLNRAAIKMANIDAIYNLTGHLMGILKYTNDEPFTFCDVAAGPGGFTEYMQFRNPNNRGYGMTLKDDRLDWNRQRLNFDRFSVTYGNDGTGNLYTNWDYFINWVLGNDNEGVDLVMADGGFDVEDANQYRAQEYLSSRLLLTQIIIGIMCSKEGGSFVLKIFDSVTSVTGQMLYLLSLCFDQLTIFKPVSSRPANAERYIVAKGRRDMNDIVSYIEIIRQALDRYQDEAYLTNIIAQELPEDFIEWLTQINNTSVELQLKSAANIVRYLGGQDVDVEDIDTHKCLTVWNLPDTPLNRKSRIHIR